MKKLIFGVVVVMMSFFVFGCGSPDSVSVPTESEVSSTVELETPKVESEMPEESEEHEHTFIYEVVKESTCGETGKATYTCECGEVKEEVLPFLAHTWSNEPIIEEATCTTDGYKSYICTVCGGHKIGGEVIKALGHDLKPTETKKATCFGSGVISYKCTRCSHKEIEFIDKLPHNIVDFKCTVCGITSFKDALNMTSTEKSTAKKVYYIGNRAVQHNESKHRFELLFSLMDGDQKEVDVPAIVKIRMEDKDGNTIYDKYVTVSSKDYSQWGKDNWSNLCAAIYIGDDEIENASSSSGTIYFTVFNEGYFSFEESSLSIFTGIPQGPMDIELPELPTRVRRLSWNGNIRVSCDILDVTFDTSGFMPKMCITIEKTYDVDGDNSNESCIFTYKVYDEENFVVASGTVFSRDMKVGEKSKEEEYISITPGRKYRIVFENYS